MSLGKSDCEKLFEEAIPLAKQMLDEYAEFHPYALVRRSNEVEHIGVEIEGEPFGKSRERLEALEQIVSEAKDSHAFTCSAIVVNRSAVVDPVSKQSSDAIQVCLRHRDGYSIDVFLPYDLDAGPKTEYGGIFAHVVDQEPLT